MGVIGCYEDTSVLRTVESVRFDLGRGAVESGLAAANNLKISDVTGETRGNCCEMWDVKVGCG